MATAIQPSQLDVLNHIFLGLVNKNSEVRLQYAQELRSYVASTVAEMSSDAAAKLWDENLTKRLFDLIHSTNIIDQTGGLLAIDHLLDVDREETIESKRNLFRFYNYVKHLLPHHDFHLMLQASKTLGKIAEIGGSAFGEGFMEKEVPAAVDLMQPEKPEAPRYAGVLILKELARNSSMYFYSHIGMVFDNILVPLRDQRLIVREGAAELLAACLEIITQRERNTRNSPFLLKILQDAQMGLKQAQPEVIHGSLLTYRELLLHGGMFMRETFLDSAEQILRFKSHRDGLIRKTVITLVPSLAAYDTQTFTEHFLHKAMAQLLTQLEKPADRPFAFVAIGHTAAAVGSDMKPFLDPIMGQIKAGLQARGRRNAPPEEPMFQCLGMLASAVGPNLTKLLHDQLDLIFACGLSEPLRQALVAIAKCIPPLLKTIQDRLLDLLSMILSTQPYKPLGAPPPLERADASSISRDVSTSQASVTGEKTPELITLALTTLGSFDFSGHILNEFVRQCALPYLEDDHPEVRRAAATTCCRLFVRDPICYQASSHAIEVISDVLDKLLTVGIADPDATIRQTVLSSLHERFDKHLAQAENVRSIFIALNDEVFDNRVTAVTLIGRLAKHNPAYVMPSLRKALIQLLTELEYSTVVRSREECTRLLTLLVGATQRLIKPYALPMLRVLMVKADDPNPTVSANVLMCLGELACVGGEDAMAHVPDLMQVILRKLSDPSFLRRDAALHTLGQICTSTGYVISPLVDHPQLLHILARILKTESSQTVRREVVKVLGIIGAMNPYRRKSRPEDDATGEKAVTAVNQMPLAAASTVAVSDDYYQTVVINALLAILRDQALSSQHHAVIEAVMSIFKTQGLKCVAFLPQIIPAFAAVTRTSIARLQEFHLQQLAILVGIIKQHIRNYMPDVFLLITDLWDNTTLQLPIVSLVEALGRALDAEFKPFLPSIIPLLLKVFEGDLTDKRMNTQMKVFDALQTFGANIEEYLHLVVPVIVKTFERADASTALRKKAMQTIDGLSKRINFSDRASRIIHPLVRVLEGSNNELRMAVMDTLCALVIQLWSDFAIFVPTINKAMLRNRVTHPNYESLISKLLNGQPIPRGSGHLEPFLSETSKPLEFAAPAEEPNFTVNQQHLKSAWDVSLVSTRDDWNDWMHRMSVEFMKESPSHALRACMSLVDTYPPLAKELFNAAFMSCWGELYDQYQEDLVRSIEFAITSSSAPSELINRLLNLAEFMEHEEKPLPIDNLTLGEYSMKYLAYAKALHYKELEFFSRSSPSIIEALISINTRLQQHDAAWGTLLRAREQYDVTKHEEWYERLGRWQEALTVYDNKALTHPNDPDVQLGRMKCLHALGDWDQLATQVQKSWMKADTDLRREIAPMAAAAAWSLTEWDSMDDYITTMRNDSPDRSFYRAILCVHRNQFPKAFVHISRARDLLDPELQSFVGEGYGRSYNIMVRAQMLSELEEIITYKQHADQPDRQTTMRKTWMKRLQGCQPDVEVWQRILQVRTLVLNPEDDPDMWIKFANLCRKNDRMALAEKTIRSLLSPRAIHGYDLHHVKAPPNVVYAQLKYMWACGNCDESLQFLREFSDKLQADVKDPRTQASPDKHVLSAKLLARCYFKQASWQAQRNEEWHKDDPLRQDIMASYWRATQNDTQWYKAWHTWALANFEVVGAIENQPETRVTDIPGDTLAAHVKQAILGFFRSISLRNEESLQDTLRLLTLCLQMEEGFKSVPIDTWLDVIPQIIARIQTPHEHPQALIYPLTVASSSSSTSRSKIAKDIMKKMESHSILIVQQARLVSRELIRVAILWHERWHEGLEEASRLYFTEKNNEGMIACLEPLHEMVEKGPETARETSFAQTFGRDLHEAREACNRYRRTGDPTELEKAWDIYYAARDLQLSVLVRCAYQAGRPVITIAKFAPKLQVIASKQRPRRFSLTGSDGRDYQYILKGHEDLRQDERVMQLFTLVNTLLSVDTSSFKRRLHIQRYPVIPLAPNAGLLGHLQDSDTLHVLVKDYRDSRKVLLNIEYRLMLQMAPDYENLTLIQKVEVFEYALENTTGQDLYRVLWLKSTNSEHWLERRACYTRSLAVNSIVGHILGLGDRHPSNILLERSTGKVVHIDFGDCFEVAMHREKFPEMIPFRLTRMLTQAMEVSGIEGSFRNTCEITMQVLRDNKESLMAVLEAFVYDPLINWRLMQTDVERRTEDPDRAVELARVAGHPQGPTRKMMADERDIFSDGVQETRNEKALAVYNRVQHKLTGRDFNPAVTLNVPQQVEKLIQQATSLENLCQCFSGWCAFW
ncbi:armadillo-type protein [Schizophyllum amplum]|uniref:Serine/threonine-protein kinase TOR n=1 Tax=Schizophyllum amplum TaxID=97359 RepID=A0A550C627_9AGAR|nr:armadillo-type protein [Auriculariopsis ampla]